MCSAKPHTSALSGGENEENEESAAAAAQQNGFSHYWRLRPKGRARPFGPSGKGGFSLLVSRPKPPQAVKSPLSLRFQP